MSLLKKLQAKQKESNSANSETISAKIERFSSLKQDDRVLIVTDKGNFFAFRNAVKQGIPREMPSAGLKASITLVEKGAYINVASVEYSFDDISKRAFVATSGVVVQL